MSVQDYEVISNSSLVASAVTSHFSLVQYLLVFKVVNNILVVAESKEDKIK